MQKLTDYRILPTEEGPLIFVIPQTKLEVISPVFLYNGGNHAILFCSAQICDDALVKTLSGRNLNFSATEALLVDYIHPDVKKILLKNEWVVIMEENSQAQNDIIRDYKAIIRHMDGPIPFDELL